MTISFIRTIILYILIIFALRIMGKRQVGELSPSEFVITLLVSELATIPMQSPSTPLLHAIVPVFTLIALEILASTIFINSRFIRKLAVGRISILIEDGKLNQTEMRKLRISLDELLEELRLKGFINISDVKYAILEANGELSVFPFAIKESPTREDFGFSQQKNLLPRTVISDGTYIKNAARAIGKTEKWIQKQLAREGIRSYREVFLMQVDENGKCNIISKEAKK